MIDSIISIQQLAKKFGSFQAVYDINIQVNRGDVYGFLGPNGAGKSTTMRCILTPTFDKPIIIESNISFT
jgi:ABC-type multidrug transport system ATPase subunit